MMLRVGGTLSLIDLGSDESEGCTSERVLADGVERFWIASGGALAPNCDADVRWSWWTYGREGTRVWYVPVTGVPTFPAPSHGGGGDSVAFADPELEFDKEAYPLGISLGDGAPLIVGATQRLAFASCSDQPCFEPTPKVQPILPCILRHLLRLGEMGAAIGGEAAAGNRGSRTRSSGSSSRRWTATRVPTPSRIRRTRTRRRRRRGRSRTRSGCVESFQSTRMSWCPSRGRRIRGVAGAVQTRGRSGAAPGERARGRAASGPPPVTCSSWISS